MNELSTKDQVPVVRIAIQNQVGDKKIINFETFVDVLTSAETMNGLVDKLMSVADRQTKRYELIDLKNLFKRSMVEYEAMLEDLKKAEEAATPRVVEGRRLPVDATKQQRTDLINLKTTVEQRRRALKKLDNDIKEREKEFSG